MNLHRTILKYRVFGFVVSVLLTLIAFSIILRPALFHLDIRGAVIAILILALFQFVVQFVCFLNLWRETGPRWNLAIFASTLSIIFIIVFFSIWIMSHLNYNMMPR